MKILYLLTDSLVTGGVQSDMLALSEDLTARGHTVYVATRKGPLLDDLLSRGARFLEIDLLYSGAGGLLNAARAIRDAVAEHGIDLVAPQSVRSSIAAALALRILSRKFAKVPIVTTIHNIHDPRNFRFVGSLLRHTSNYVVFESNYERNRVVASGMPSERTFVIYSGVDGSTFTPLPRNDELLRQASIPVSGAFVFGIVARLSPEKAHTVLLDAFAQVNARRPDAHLLVIGDGPLREAVHRHADALPLSRPSVHFVGSQNNVDQWLSVIDVFVLSSTRESFPLSGREAQAAGRPVILPNIGGCGEVVSHEHTGLLFESGNSSDLARQMLRLMESVELGSMGIAARERATRLFSRRTWVERNDELYCSLARGELPRVAAAQIYPQ